MQVYSLKPAHFIMHVADSMWNRPQAGLGARTFKLLIRLAVHHLTPDQAGSASLDRVHLTETEFCGHARHIYYPMHTAKHGRHSRLQPTRFTFRSHHTAAPVVSGIMAAAHTIPLCCSCAIIRRELALQTHSCTSAALRSACAGCHACLAAQPAHQQLQTAPQTAAVKVVSQPYHPSSSVTL